MYKPNYFVLYLYVLLIYFASLSGKRPSQEKPIAKFYSTTLDKSKLLEETSLFTSAIRVPVDATITVDTAKTYQQMDGFGFTLTGGSAMHLYKMSELPRQQLLKELFSTDADAIGISYLRLSIGASDLDEKTWSYNDLPNGETDRELKNFSLAYDTLYLVPLLKEILDIAPKIKILGSPWSPPAWMKNNNDTRGGSLKPEYYDVYAEYFVKYIKAMQKNRIRIDAVTVQNEPLHPENNPSLLMLADEQTTFIKKHLGPLFRKNSLNTKIIIYDHNADRPDYPISILNDSVAAKYIDGSAFHLYRGKIEALSTVHEKHPDKNLYFTEQWIGAPGDFTENVSWHTENLIIGAPRNWCKTVLQWNLAADEQQAPHTDRGGCVGCLGALSITGDKIVRNPAYYIIAQVSKFVRPGSVRVASNIENNILNVAYTTPNGDVVVLLQNKNEEEKNIIIKVGSISIPVLMEAGSIGSLVF